MSMLPRDRAKQILALGKAGWSVRAIADQLGHSQPTIRDYLNGRRTPGLRAPRPSLLTDLLAGYCRQRLAEDPHLRPSALFNEVSELGFRGSRSTFYRALTLRRLSPTGQRQPRPQQDPPHDLAAAPRPVAQTPAHTRALPRSVTPITGEALISYLTRLANANQLTVGDVLDALPTWFTTKINNGDDRAQHHMVVPATGEALHALARLSSTTPDGLARAFPAFDATDASGPARATTACHRCAARRGIHQPIPVYLPIHHKICTRHGIWLNDTGQPHLDLAACPEIVTAQRRVNRLLRRFTPQQVTLAYHAATTEIPAWAATPSEIPLHWRYRLLTLQTTNHHRGIPIDHDVYTQAAIYPDAVNLAATILRASPPRTNEQDLLTGSPDSPGRHRPWSPTAPPVEIPH